MPANKFNGTSVSREHIGDKESDNLAALISDDDNEAAKFSASIGVEAADIIPVTLQAQSLGGKDLAKAVRVHARVYDANMVEALVGAATITASGGASAVTGATQAAGLFDLGADGAGILSVEDISGALAGDLILELIPVNRPGVASYETLTFA